MKATDMQSRIELEIRGREAATIKDLNLDNCRSTQIEGLTDDFVNLEQLSLINVGLTTLKGFPTLPKLRHLELSDNRISNGLNNLLSCTAVSHLNLSGNKIKDVEVLGPLAKLEKLSHLDLFNCEITATEQYRDVIFKMLPQLKYLDGFDKDNQEDEEDEEYNAEDDDEEDEDEEEGEDDDEDDDDEDDDEEDDEAEEEEFDEEEVDDVVVVNKKAATAADAQEKPAEGAESEDDEDDDEEGDETEVGISYLQKSNLPEDDDDEDFDAAKAEQKLQAEEAEEEEDDDDEDEEIDADEVAAVDAESEVVSGGRKRKHDDNE